jgi:hypothetical protein
MPGTVASAQGMTIGSSRQYGVCCTPNSNRARRTLAHVGMTRGRDENHLGICPSVTDEAHQHRHDRDTVILPFNAAPNALRPKPFPRS